MTAYPYPTCPSVAVGHTAYCKSNNRYIFLLLTRNKCGVLLGGIENVTAHMVTGYTDISENQWNQAKRDCPSFPA